MKPIVQKILMSIQILAFVSGTNIAPIAYNFNDDDVQYHKYIVQISLNLTSLVIKVVLTAQKHDRWFKKLLVTQKNFLIGYVLLVMVCYFLYFTKTSIERSLADQVLSIISFCIQFFNYSLLCSFETIVFIEYICYFTSLVVWDFQYAYFTVGIIQAGQEIDGIVKDIYILFCTTIIATGVFIMDLTTRSIEVQQERKRIAEQHEELKTKLIQLQSLSNNNSNA